jgi:hypothetical protein
VLHKYFIKIQIVKKKSENLFNQSILSFFFPVTDRVVLHGPITFQSFTFIPRLLERIIDIRHICFSNLPNEINHIESYIDTVSIPYKKINYEYYQNDRQIIVVEYNEDIGKINFEIKNIF